MNTASLLRYIGHRRSVALIPNPYYLSISIFDIVILACLVGTVVRRWTAVLEVVGSVPALAKQRTKFLGLLRLPARVGL